jgi:tetratricopeptide (TPR) repeat protein
LFGSGRAFADNDRARARLHYQEGENAFRTGDFDVAIREFKDSYHAFPEPLLLYNVAQAYRLKGDLKQALFFYQQFVSAAPRAPQRPTAEDKIAELRKLIANQEQAQQAPPAGTAAPPPPNPVVTAPPPTPSPPAPRPWYKSPAGWALGGGGLALVVVGAALLGSAPGVDDQAAKASSLQSQHDLQDRASAFRAAGYSLVAIGGAAVVGSVIVFAVAGRSKKPAVNALRLSPSSNGLGLSLGGGW